MSSITISIIIDKKAKSVKLINNRPGYDMKYVESYIYEYSRIIQSAWKRFRGRVPSNARLVWNSLPNDNTPDDEKFLGLTRHKIKNPQTQEQFNQWRTKWIELYKQCNLNIPLDIYK
ncbi:1532_t:CDS:2 [Entrophospora sp. SA101]|nr:1532_t:CDS:2 [Entrophospora sp. SA101]